MKRPCLCAHAVLVLLATMPVAGSGAPAAAKSCDPGYGSPGDRIAACAGGYADPARLAGAFQAKLGLSADTAGRLAQAMAQAHALEESDENRGRDQTRDLEPVRKIESQFIFLLRREPGNEAVAVEAGWFYAFAGRGQRFMPDSALFDLLHAAADPARLTKTLIAPVDGSPADQTAQIVLAALDVRSTDSSLWEKAARAAPAMGWRLAFREEAFRTADAASPEAARLAVLWLSGLLEQGLTRQAFTVYQGLTPDLRSRVEHGVPASADRGVDRESPDLLSSLAAAALLEGDGETARRLASLPVPPSGKSSGTKAVRIAVSSFRRRLLERTFTSSSDDPFELFATALGLSSPRLDSTGDLLLARLATREKYPALAAYELRNAVRALRDDEEPFEPARGIPPRVRASAAALAAERSALAEGLDNEARAAEDAARTGDMADPAAATIARLLRTPIPAAFDEHPLPAGVALVDVTDEAAEKQLAAAAKGLSLPAGACLARVEREGSRVAAIVSSQGYDPTGEVSSGAYWLLLSTDGGATWSDPLYTGLRINQPYIVRPVSALPLFAGDHLHVEVEIRELDPAKIYFPPVGLAPKRTARGLYLDIPLEALTRDSDGDGLTDLAEARLLTDPNAADTDGDGIPDGADPLPTVRESADRSPAALALAAFAESIRGAGGQAIIGGVGAPLVCCSAKNKTQGPETVLFFTAERPLFAALHPSLRIIVLTHDEKKEAERRFGPFFPTDLQLFFLDRTGRHAFLIWSSGWQGGTLRLDEKNGTWKTTQVGGWIT